MAELVDLAEPAILVGRAPLQVERLLQLAVEPALRGVSPESLGPTELRV
jgi:hypothetical protein